MGDWLAPVFSIAAAAIGLAAFAVFLSPKAQTASVIQAGASGLGSIISAAVAPVATTSTTTGLLGG